jgi:hypothetical protein
MPGLIEVTAKKGDAEGTINYDFGEHLEEMCEKFGDSVVFTNARANMKIVLQAAMRRRLEAGQPVEDLADNWKPGVQMERIVDPIAAAKAKYATMNEDEKAAFLEELRSL